MLFTTPDGRAVYVPGVYSETKVISNLPGPVPEFLIPVIVGQADEARYPYTFPSGKLAVESTHVPFLGLGSSSAVKEAFGADSDLATATTFAKRHGLPWAFYVAINALTRASVIATSAGPVSQFTFFAKKYGAVGGHIKLKVVSGTTLTVTPVKRYSLLTANAVTGASRLYVKDSTWLNAGDAVVIGDNNSTDTAYVVDSVGTELNSTGQVAHFVELTTTLAADITTAQYGMVLQWDVDAEETPDAFSDIQAMVDWLNISSKYVGAQKTGTFSNTAALVALATAAPIKEITVWSTATAGTSPAATSSDHTTFITNLDARDWDAFAIDQQVIPQAFLILESSSTIHGLWRDWAVDKRAINEPISVTTGCAWGDIVMTASDDTNPGVRAAALNSQDVMLAAGGIDKIAAYLSLAPAIFGRRIGGGLRHNLTNDELVYANLEVFWDERNSGYLTTLHKKGVATYRLSTSRGVRYVVSQGLSTLQGANKAWDEVTKKTPLVMQRDLADFCDRVAREDLDGTQVGADEVDQSTIAAVLVRRAEKTLKKRNYITAYQIILIELDAAGAGWNIDWSIRLPVTNDFMGLRTHILIGEE